MKKILSLLIVVLLVSMGAYSQAPGIFNYQGVARNSVGNVLVNKTITLRLTIHDVTAAGAVVYQESRTVVTNPFGLFNVQVGSAGAANVTGTVAGVPWGVGAKFIQVEIDPNGGTTFINIGTAQIASVPYSLFSTTAGDLVLPFVKTQADAGTLFRINNSGTGISGAIMGTTSSNAVNAWGVQGQVNNTSAGAFSSGILGTNLSTSGNGIGVTGTQAGSGWGVYGTTPSGRGVYGATTTGVGVYGQSTGAGTGGFFTSASGLALNTAGGVRLTGINEALNRILTSDAAGNATWQDPSGVGIVTGSGTLNFVPKWTPNGTNLGNSMIFDDGNNIGINTTTPLGKLNVNSGTAFVNTNLVGSSPAGTWLSIGNTDPGGRWFNIINTATTNGEGPGKLIFFQGGAANLATGNILTMVHANRNVGINTTAPTTEAKLHVDGYGGTVASFNRTSIYANGSVGASNGHGVIADGEWRGVWGRNLGASGRTESSGVRGDAGGSNYTNGAGIWGTSSGTGTNNYGSIGISANGTFNIGAYGQAAIGPNNWAGVFYGRVFIQDGTEGAGKVFVSDAIGNGSWQTIGGGVGVGGSGTLNFIPKWTPDGFNLGNSLLFDNGTGVGLGTITPTHRFDVIHSGSTGIGVSSTSGFSVVDIDAQSGDAAIRFGNNGTNQWNIRNRPLDNYFEFFELGGGGSRVVIQDGTGNVGIGETTNPIYKLDVLHGGGDGIRSRSSASYSVVDIDAANGDAALRFQLAGTTKWNLRNDPATNNLQIVRNNALPANVTILNTNGNVGIGNTAPTSALHVTNANNSVSATIEQTSAGNANNAMFIDNVNATSAATGASLQGGAGLYVRKGTGSTIFFNINPSAVIAAVSAANGVGVMGLASGSSSFGVAGVTNGVNSFGVIGQANSASGTGVYALAAVAGSNALFTNGPIQLTGISEGAGKVLTSDATGVATWQGPVSISGEYLLADVPVPSGADVNITNWSTITNEDGGANYNAGTGEYTVTVSGYYDINGSLNWLNFTVGQRARVYVLVNNVRMTYESGEPSGGFGTVSVHYARRLVAGDKVRFQVNHTSGVTENLASLGYGTTFDIHLVHR